MESKQIIYREEAYEIIGACFEVYKEKGHGFSEGVFQECLELELKSQALPFVAQQHISLEYKGTPLKQSLVPDFVVHDKIILEIKAVREIVDEHRAQVLNYLKASGFRLGLLVNFGHYPKAQYERLVFGDSLPEEEIRF